jgi:dihydropteroate synthase
MLLRARHFEFVLPRPVLIAGIVNVTPDSFSDGGKFFDTNSAVEHGLKLVEQGAEILDIGGESTRPRATPVPEAEELRRVIPVIEQLAARVKIPLSIDTMKPAVARAAIAAGAVMVNDVAANREDDALWRVVAETGAAYVVMHMQGTPQTMQAHPHYTDVVREVRDFFSERMQRLAVCGIAPEQVIFDVGIGFGKTLEHNLLLIAALRSFTTLERPLLLGVSRKSFLGKVLGAETPGRLPAALACTAAAVQAGVQIIRTHDVAETVQAVRTTESIMAHTK